MKRQPRLDRRQRRSLRRNRVCPMCHQVRPFLFTCPCGFAICDLCMQRDMWGFSCNGITWVCPDCGEVRSF